MNARRLLCLVAIPWVSFVAPRATAQVNVDASASVNTDDGAQGTEPVEPAPMETAPQTSTPTATTPTSTYPSEPPPPVSDEPSNLWGRAVYGLRLAYALPAGGLYNDVPVSDWAEGGLQLQLDLNFKLNHELIGGFYLSLTFPGASDELMDGCGAYGHECSPLGIQIGVQGEYHVQPAETLDPWVGAGIAIEGLSIHETGPMTDVSLFLTGPTFSVSGGFNMRFGGLSFGPYLSYQLGWYGSVSIDYGPYNRARGDVEDTSLHHWFIAGLRGSFAPWTP